MLEDTIYDSQAMRDLIGIDLAIESVPDATIIAAAPSTKNRTRQRDPEMKQTKKGNQWYFGMKAHIGVDAATGLTHTVVATSANVADVTMAGDLMRDDDERVYGDAGYLGMGNYLGEEKNAPDSRCCIAAKRGAIKKMDEGPIKTLRLAIEKTKASIRAKVEHPFHVVKNLFGYRKARYKGLAKNQAQLFTLFALGNLVLAGRCLVNIDGGSAS